MKDEQIVEMLARALCWRDNPDQMVLPHREQIFTHDGMIAVNSTIPYWRTKAQEAGSILDYLRNDGAELLVSIVRHKAD